MIVRILRYDKKHNQKLFHNEVVFDRSIQGNRSMRRSKKHITYLFSLAYLMSTLPVAAGETTPEQQAKSDTLIEEGVEHYSSQRYNEAIECFKQAYEIIEEPELLFNIARSYEKMSNNEEAVRWYERFLGAPNTNSDLRTLALHTIAALRQKIDAQKVAEDSEGAPSDGTSVSPEADTEPDTEASSDTTMPQSADTDSQVTDLSGSQDGSSKTEKMSPLKISGYSLLGGGVAALVVGSVFGGLLLAVKDDFDSSGLDPDRVQYREDMKRNALVCDIMFFGGAALVAAGGSLLIVERIKRKSKSEVAIGNRRREGRNSTIEGNSVNNRKSANTPVMVTPAFIFGNSGFAGGLVGHF